MLEEIRMANVNENIINKIQQKINNYNFTDKVLETDYIVGYRNMGSNINNIVGNYLLSANENESPYESVAIDYMGNAQITLTKTDKLFCHYTNFPTKIILKE
ncbi:2223_t:CDS:1, partial [Diversispora eburnea]